MHKRCSDCINGALSCQSTPCQGCIGTAEKRNWVSRMGHNGGPTLVELDDQGPIATLTPLSGDWGHTVTVDARTGAEFRTLGLRPEDTVPASTNPKGAFGMKKPPLHLIPEAALIHMAMSFKDGAAKYGPFNWRIDPVDATTYVAAAKRHMALWFNGQDLASDSKVHNLGAVMACCAILLDAEASGSLVDNRPPAQDLEAVMDRWTEGKGLPS